MALFAKKVGGHLAPSVREALQSCTRYPPVSVIANPVTREVARRVINAEWNALKLKLDFSFRAEDCVLGGIECIRYATESHAEDDRCILYLHGGAFVAGSARTNAATILPTCHLSGLQAIAVEYPLAPEHPFPLAHEAIEKAYKALIAAGTPPEKIIIVGDSAGGNLAITSVLRWRRLGLPAPAGMVLLSPLADGAGMSDTVFTLRNIDPLVSTNRPDLIRRLFRFYTREKNVRNPEISPVYADMSDLPPLLIHVGAREILLGDSARLAEKARTDGVDVSLRVFDGMFHLFHMNWSLPETKSAHGDIVDFIHRCTQP